MMPVDTTQHLCAAVQHNWRLRTEVIQQFIEADSRCDCRAMAPCSEVNTAAVARHALCARRRKAFRDLLLVLLLVLTSISFLFLMQSDTADSIIARLAKYAFIPLSIFIVLVESLASRLSIIQKEKLSTEDIASPFSALKDSDANVMAYGAFDPFANFGNGLNKWSFCIDATKGKEELGRILKPESFNTKDIYESIADDIRDMNIPNTNIKDLLFIDGRKLARKQHILPHPLRRPNSYLDTAPYIERADHDPDLRHYRCIQITAWDGDLILSVFIRFTLDKYLFVEGHFYVLPPISEEYRILDRWNEKITLRSLVRLILYSVFAAPWHLFFAPLGVAYFLINPMIQKLHGFLNRWRLLEDNSLDRGAPVSLRKYASTLNYEQYFQFVDSDLCRKIIETQILESIRGFLNDNNIDTSQFKERSTIIENHGVVMTGGTVHADNVAIGRKARAQKRARLLRGTQVRGIAEEFKSQAQQTDLGSGS